MKSWFDRRMLDRRRFNRRSRIDVGYHQAVARLKHNVLIALSRAHDRHEPPENVCEVIKNAEALLYLISASQQGWDLTVSEIAGFLQAFGLELRIEIVPFGTQRAEAEKEMAEYRESQD